nr:LCP family protein [uncultured Merdimonas sp.]
MRKVKKKTKGKGLWNWMKRHKVISGILCLLILCFLVMAMSLGVLLWNLNKNNVGIVDPDDVDPNADKVQIAREDQKDKDVINVLLVGSDSRDPNAEMGRSDTMILASFNKAEGKATALSFLRDSLVEIDGHGQSKLGHTYAYGGVGLTINTLNKQFGLDIQNYVVINFENLVEIIDQLGGIQVVLTEEEAEYYRENGMPEIVAGNVTLTGSQALAHARNRSLDNDFGRTERQRDVIYGIYNKVLEQRNNPATLMSLIKFCMTQVSTNMSVTELYEMATEVLSVDNLKTQQAAIPAEGTYEFGTYEDMSVLNIDLEANKEYIQELLY